VTGWLWAVLCALLAPAVFFSFEKTPQLLADITGMKISPRFSGGEAAETIAGTGYKAVVRRPVFDGLFSERKDGFIQIDFEPDGQFPPVIARKFSYNKNGIVHGFTLTLDTAKPAASLSGGDSAILSVAAVARTRNAIIVRVALRQ